MRRVALIALVSLAGCWSSEPAAPPVSKPVPSNQPKASAQAQTVSAPVKVVDLRGNPLANMMPIATTHPNAFDAPVAKGGLTGPDGLSSIDLENGKYVYVRAWDPTRRMFANNYFDVIPGEKAIPKDPLTVVMVPGASLEMAIIGPDQKPAANTVVDIMMYHPQKGPWWPDQTTTDGQGVAHFACVPPGKFLVKLKSHNGGHKDIPDVALPPAGNTDLGTVVLQ